MAEMRYKTPEDWEKKVDEFIQAVSSGLIDRPSDYNLSIFAGISIPTLTRYYAGSKDNADGVESIYKGYDVPLKKLIAYRADRLEGIAESNPKAATPAIFLLKQPHNGGYTDRQIVEQSGDVSINLTIKGSSGKDLKR